MKNKNSLLIMMLITLSTLFLSACSAQEGNTNGFFHTYFVEPFVFAIKFLADLFNGNYGLSIILVTLIIRLCLLPFMLKQSKKQMLMKEKMDVFKPELEEIQNKLKNETDIAKKQELQKEMMGLYQKHGINPLNMGCLPILIQMPILTGFYYAIRGSEEIATHQFLWFSLGQPDIIITIAAGLIYYLQFKVSQSSMPVQQQQQMKFMGLLSPLMIVMFSISAPAALPLYWSVGGAFLVLQSILSRKLYQSSQKTKLTDLDIKPN